MKALPVTPDQPEVGTWVLLWENGTWLRGYRLYDGWRIIYADGQRDYSPEEVQVTYWTLLPPDPSDESPSSDPAEVLQLRQWKKEATALLAPILEYGLKHPEIKLGQSATSFVLNRAKAAEVLAKAIDMVIHKVADINDSVTNDVCFILTEARDQFEQLKQHP